MVEALRRLWTDTCDITARVAEDEADPETGRTVFREETIVTGEPCRISFKLTFENVSGAKEDGIYATVRQSAKLFLDRNIPVPPGSIITVTRNGEVFEFIRSGAPAIYDYHQEIKVEKYKDWA